MTMSPFWSGYVSFLTIFTLIAMAVLIFATRKGQRNDTTNDTVGHSYDGIEEYDNPLPRWWFMLFVGTIIFATGYLVLYPGLGNWKGVLPGYEDGWTQVKQYERELEKAKELYDPLYEQFNKLSVVEVSQNEEALAMGRSLFLNNCAVCHGSDGRGSLGFPNLADNDWRWGGEPETIKQTIMDGRQGIMAAWGETLGNQGVKDVAAYVREDLAKRPRNKNNTNEYDKEKGKQTFATICSACHTPQGTGMAALGAPNLTHPEGWIYGTSQEAVEATVRNGRHGVMPAQRALLGESKVHILAGYVYSLSHRKNAQ